MSDVSNMKTIMGKIVNRYPELGHIEVMGPLDQDYGFDVQVHPDDVVIYTDFTDESLTDDDSINQFAEWYNNTLHYNIEKQMRMFGYQAIAGNDGSGGGLYYGAILFRRIK